MKADKEEAAAAEVEVEVVEAAAEVEVVEAAVVIKTGMVMIGKMVMRGGEGEEMEGKIEILMRMVSLLESSWNV